MHQEQFELLIVFIAPLFFVGTIGFIIWVLKLLFEMVDGIEKSWAILKKDTKSKSTNFFRELVKRDPDGARQADQKVALHEAGHAIVNWYLPYALVLEQVALKDPETEYTDSESRGHCKAYWRPSGGVNEAFNDNIALCFGGIVAEEKIGIASTGGLSDLQQARNIAKSILVCGGVGSLLGVPTGSNTSVLTSSIQADLQKQIDEYLLVQRKRAQEIVEQHWDEVLLVARALIEKRKLSEQDLIELLGPRELVPLQPLVPELTDNLENSDP